MFPLQTYLNQFAFGSSTYSDLWYHLQMVSRCTGLREFMHANSSMGQHSCPTGSVSMLDWWTHYLQNLVLFLFLHEK